MKKLTLKQKLEVVRKLHSKLKAGLYYYMCNALVDISGVIWEEPIDRDKFIKLNFNELYEYKPKEAQHSAWFMYNNTPPRLLILEDLIYRYEKALAQKKPVSKIKGNYKPLPYKFEK